MVSKQTLTSAGNDFEFSMGSKSNKDLKMNIQITFPYIYIFYLEIYPFTTGATTTGVIVAASIRYKVIFTNDT